MAGNAKNFNQFIASGLRFIDSISTVIALCAAMAEQWGVACPLVGQGIVAFDFEHSGNCSGKNQKLDNWPSHSAIALINLASLKIMYAVNV
jgi:hypothetical protein